MKAQERLISVLDETLTEEDRGDPLLLLQRVNDALEWIADIYEIDPEGELMEELIASTDIYF